MKVRMATAEAGVQVFRGRLRESANSAFEKLKRSFARDRVPLLQEDPKLGATILLLPKLVEEQKLEKPVRPWLHLVVIWPDVRYEDMGRRRAPRRELPA